MNELLKARFQQCHINEQNIIKYVKTMSASQGVIVYTSHLEGLGTADSDFDVYVIYNNDFDVSIRNEHVSSKCAEVYYENSFELDIEYWGKDKVTELIKKFNEGQYEAITLNEFKFLYRLIKGEILENESFIKGIIMKVKISEFNNYLINCYLKDTNSLLYDALDFYNDKDFLSSILLGRKALESLMGAINANNGYLCVKPKWINRICERNLCSDDPIWLNYLNFMFFSSINVDNMEVFSTNLLQFIQDNITKLTASWAYNS